jgi:putative inorganic carbon (hco3(-)) transporter
VKASLPEALGLLAALGAAAVAVLAPSARIRALSVWIALLAAAAVIAGDVWHQQRFEDLRSDPALVAAAGLAAVVGIVGVAWVFRRTPAAFPILAFLVLPFRVPVEIGGQTSNLLLPLYLMIAAAAASAAFLAVRDAAPPGPARVEPAMVRALRAILAATLLLYAIQALYSVDVSNAIENAAFFLVPFAVLFVLLAEVEWSEWLLRRVLLAVSAAAVALALVAVWEYAARDLLLNRGLEDANQLHRYFRVNSLFKDPNIFGRYLALAIVVLAAGMVWTRDVRLAAGAAVVAAVLALALAMSFSMTSFAALIAGLLVLGWLRWGFRAAVLGALAVAVAGGVFLGVRSGEVGSERDLSSGRGDLVSGGIELAGDRPVWGWGSGSFGAAFQRRIERAPTTNSHTEPVTVAAEQGAVGMIVYGALLAVALVVLLGQGRRGAAQAAVACGFVTMLVHSLGYASFAVDPATWALLALGVACARLPTGGDASPGVRDHAAPVVVPAGR